MTKDDDTTVRTTLPKSTPPKVQPTPNVRPCGEDVLILVHHKPQKTASGILLPERMGREDMATVVRIGERVTKALASFSEEPWTITSVGPGDVVRFDPYKVRLVIDEALGYDATGSAYAKGGQHAIIPESAISFVVEPDGAS